MEQEQMIKEIKNYFEQMIFENHRKISLSKHTKLKSYSINPIIVKYLSKVLESDYTPLGVAKALYYPRVLGTSINTSFGSRIQSMFVELGLAKGSLIKGMDIEFEDQLDGRKKWCQLKAGPNTINSEDVKPLLRKFSTVANLARTNNINLGNNDLVLGVIYGETSQLSQHYRKIDEHHPVHVGNDFWNRITGYEDFYSKLISQLDALIESNTYDDFLERGYTELAREIEVSELFSFEK
jgi:hypothetical protein